jgi:hemolysin III
MTRSHTVPATGIPPLLEEIANSVTGGIGLLLSVAGLSALVIFASLYGTVWHVVSCSIYGATLVLLYGATTLYHSIPHPKAKQVLQVVDHVSIYLLIAGTYTPFALVTLRGGWGWTLFGLAWGLCFFGILFKVVFAARYDFLSTVLYVAMGWIVLIAINPVMAALPSDGLIMLLIGGLAYTFGVVFYLLDTRLPFFHAIWHLFVLAGSVLHYFAVMYFVVLV